MNKLTSSIFDTKLKQAHLATNSDFNVISQRANKNKKKNQKKAQRFDLSYFRGENFLEMMVFKRFVVQPTFSTISLK